MDENKDLREKEKEWNEEDYSYDYDYQNCNDDSSEITEIENNTVFSNFWIKLVIPQWSKSRERYRELSLKYHPDRNKSADTTTKMTEINSAYEIIMEAMA